MQCKGLQDQHGSGEKLECHSSAIYIKGWLEELFDYVQPELPIIIIL